MSEVAESSTIWRVLVVGSHSPAIGFRVGRLPHPGETVLGEMLSESTDGGKGSNQAVALARLGAPVSFIGCVGRDLLGDECEQMLSVEGVDIKCLERTNTATGRGVNIIDSDGIPVMIVAAGANNDLDSHRVASSIDCYPNARVLMTQLETPISTVLSALAHAHKRGLLTILNAAPAPMGADELLGCADVLVVNEIEAASLLGISVDEINSEDRARQLSERVEIPNVVITLGSKGAIASSDSQMSTHPAPTVSAIDTSGAGDVFCAALAAEMAEGAGLSEACAFAVRVAALSVLKPGSIPSFPRAEDVLNIRP